MPPAAVYEDRRVSAGISKLASRREHGSSFGYANEEHDDSFYYLGNNLFLLDDQDEDLEELSRKLRLSNPGWQANERLSGHRASKESGSTRRHLQTQNQSMQAHNCLTIEELKVTRNSCWLCGCNWQQDHVSLDCPECDGYALSRPCPSCDGRCQQVWQRNISATHDHHKALWVGQCSLVKPGSAGAQAELKPSRSSSSCCSSALSSDGELDYEPTQAGNKSQPERGQKGKGEPCLCN